MPSFDDFVDKTENLIEQRKLGQALDYMDEHLSSYLQEDERDLYNELILHKGAYVRLSRDERRGFVTRELAQVEQARLASRLLQYLDAIPFPANWELTKERTELVVAESAIVPDVHAFQQLMGINNLKNIAWMEKGVRAADSVCRILTPDGGYGTGFMISPTLLMTNSHVIPSKAVANQSFAEFGYQEDADGNALQTIRYRLDSKPFHSSPENELDYAIVGVIEQDDKPRLDKWGYLELNPSADPVAKERVSIIQHPNGGLKQIVLRANEVVRTWKHRLQYRADTLKGSSGSPVFNDQWHVVAIHHAGGELPVNEYGDLREVNEGILMSAIKPDAGDSWPKMHG